MKRPIIRKSFFYIVLGLLVFFPTLAAFSSQQGVASKVKKATQKIDKKGQIKTTMPMPKNIVKANVRYQGGVFFTEARKTEIKVTYGDKGKPLACDTCHNQDNRDFLVTSKGSKIDLDHVYDMCGQCHFRQKKDWIGGAHGKRVVYWAGERVVKNCTSCHNPHSPRFEKRWPQTYSVPHN